ncbi:Cytoskeleton protein RodZ [Ephemeroptericola cinctiostellae]|uniref:Cytoskeleton protein RodZ n=1 Tax=Ephemeroptericola cinctiostellae TaxID=2268024 RepID=A0A345DAJ9_9BURK|nr:helix-turn-helix domain-containing protein [Ephemeroptericola cinctiostellae]AXF85387.1 Cytoskeleton protein RodZ [Ephemeroptericola cinctiostellae]
MSQQDNLHLNAPSQVHPAVTALTLGQWLVQARQAKGMSAQDVSSRSNRALRQIEALEADNLNTAGSANLLRAIVRHYAKVVGADPEEAVRHLPAEYQTAVATAPVRASRVSEVVSSQGAPLKSPWIAKTWLVLLALIVMGLLAYWVLFSRLTQKADGAQKITEPNQVQVVAPPAPAVDPAAVAAAQAVTDAAVAANAVTDGLNLKFKVASWVEIKDAKGTVLLSGTQEAGTEQTVSGELPLKVKVGNASQVDATWKGQPYDLKAAIVSKSKDVAKIDALN